MRRYTLRMVVASLATGLLYLLLLRFPQPLFAYELEVAGLVVRSTEPIPDAMRGTLARVQQRLARTPLVRTSDRYQVFICQPRWLFALFARLNYQVGGIAHPFVGGHVFLRESDLQHDRLISPRGTPVAADRPLSYFIAHEIVHVAQGRSLSALEYWRLPRWVKDGYADYIARDIDLSQTLTAFKAQERALDPARSGLYLRYHLMVAYALDRLHMDVQTLFRTPPDEQWVEQQLAALDAW
jgi:hypothetical protein